VSGVVKAQIRVVDGVVTDVTILSGPRVFHDVVTDAVKRYKCVVSPEEVVATQEFVFKLDERAERKVRYVTVPNGSTFNLIQYQKTTLNKFSITPKEGDGMIAIPTCRLSTIGVVDLQGKSSAEFISDAINLELIEAGLFSPQFFLKISIDAVDFSSTLSTYWNFKVTITNPFGASVTIDDRFQFKGGADGPSSCDNGTLAFIPAVRELIFKILSNKDLKKLIPQIEKSDSSNPPSQATQTVGSTTVPKGASRNAEWAGLVKSAIQQNTSFVPPPEMAGNPQTTFRINLTSECALVGVERIRSSGVPEWDQAAEGAIRKVNPFPGFPGGKCPPHFELSHRPNE
jgi:hypothetical protein